MVAQHLAVVAGEDDDGVFSLPGFFQCIEQATDILVDQLDH